MGYSPQIPLLAGHKGTHVTKHGHETGHAGQRTQARPIFEADPAQVLTTPPARALSCGTTYLPRPVMEKQKVKKFTYLKN
jgi:hypothetical protein